MIVTQLFTYVITRKYSCFELKSQRELWILSSHKFTEHQFMKQGLGWNTKLVSVRSWWNLWIGKPFLLYSVVT
jgi:hypothetical protein